MKIPDPTQAAGLQIARDAMQAFVDGLAAQPLTGGQPLALAAGIAAVEWLTELLDCLDHAIAIEIPVNGTLGCTFCMFRTADDDCDLRTRLILDAAADPPTVHYRGPLPDRCPWRDGYRVVIGGCTIEPGTPCERCGGRGTVPITWPTTSCREDDRAICGLCHGDGCKP